MIKNIVFDIGNVLVRWDPKSVVSRLFPHNDHEFLTTQIFRSDLWMQLNLGKITEEELRIILNKNLGIDLNILETLLFEIKESLTPIEGSFKLLETLHQAQFPVYVISDNTHDIMAYLRKKYNFWWMFQAIIISAEIGYLKPSPQIYQHLLQNHQLKPQETVFIDDLPINIDGARALDMHGIVFQNTSQCIEALKSLNVLI